MSFVVRLPPSGSTDEKKLLITPHPRGAKHPFYWAAPLRVLPVANKRSAVEPPIQKRRGAKHPFLGRLSFAALTCRLHATSPTGTFKRCRRRISGTYRTYRTYRTKADRMAGAKHPFYWAALANACRLYIGFKRARAKLKSPIQKRRLNCADACLPPTGKHTGWNGQTVPQAHFRDL